jgi:GNAT superfamily N-acetyltransferase
MHIRKGERKDLPTVLELVKELAEFERAAHEVTNSLSLMEKDGFGENPVFGFLVAEDAEGIHGISVYYYRYSTWKGKRLYLEDFVVSEAKRGQGIGKLLFDHTMKQSIEDNCTGMMWQVLEWNQPAIDFYARMGTRFDKEWTNCSLERDQIQVFLNK